MTGTGGAGWVYIKKIVVENFSLSSNIVLAIHDLDEHGTLTSGSYFSRLRKLIP